MLYIHIYKEIPSDCIRLVNEYFNEMREKDWFNREDVKQIILDIDKTVAVKDEYMESPVYGAIAPTALSSGCKAVILMAVLDNPHIYGTRCGDNCVPSILRIAEKKDVTITLMHCMKFPESGFTATIVETGHVIHTMKEFVDEFYFADQEGYD